MDLNTRSYCETNDYICNTTIAGFRACRGPSSGCGHFSYVNTSISASAGTWAGNLVKGLPPLNPPAPPVNNPPPPVSQPGPVNYTYQVYHTGNVGLNIRSAPSATGNWLGNIPEGGAVTITCQMHGQRVLAETDIWDQLAGGGWVYDEYVTTPVVGGFSIRQC